MKARIVLVYVGLCFLWGLLTLRAAYLQFVPHSKLQTLQSRQFQTVVTLPARRGAILDRNGRELAISQPAYSLFVDPKVVENRKSVSKKIAKIINANSDVIYSKIKDESKRFVWIERMLDQSKVDQLKDLDIHGLGFVEEWKRVYPNDSILSQTIGFMGGEGQALEGLEMQYDSKLRGNEKKVSVRRDARGRALLSDGLMFTENSEGHELKLTIDAELQYELESELVQAVQKFDAENAVGVILDAKTSAIRAMAAVPTFDLNKAAKTTPDQRRNRVVTDVLEPGSTMKTFVIATALKNKLVQPNTKFYCERGSFKVGNKIIHEAESHEVFENLSVTEILAVSSNIGTTKIGFKVGDQLLKQGLQDFGFGSKTGVDLPVESRGIFNPLPWKPHLLSNISFGHGISATPLQVANAYAVIANGGVLNSPYIVDQIKDVETNKTVQIEPKQIRRVLSAEEASQMRMMLTMVTAPGGTGTNARVNGFVVGGKTGTAQKAIPGGRGYMKGAYISSFAGMIPASDPKFVIYVAVDHPKKAYYGSQVAAPIFSKLASFAVRKEGLTPQLLADKSLMPEELKNLSKDDLKSNKEGSKKIAKDSNKQNLEIDSTSSLVPDLRHLTLREVLRRVNKSELKLKVVGARGVVQQVIPEPGSAIPEDKKITVILENSSVE